MYLKASSKLAMTTGDDDISSPRLYVVLAANTQPLEFGVQRRPLQA